MGPALILSEAKGDAGLPENLLEQRDGTRVFALAQPEQRRLPELGVRICSGYPDKYRDAFVHGPLRQRDHAPSTSRALIGDPFLWQ